MSDPLQGLPGTIGRYQLKSLLGRGGMGRVVLGHDPLLHRDVALKLVEPAGVDAQALRELGFMFHREARATAALRHPGIIEVYEYSGPDAEIPYLACELIEGPTLRAVLERVGRLPARVAASVGHELAQALGHAHSRGIVHRDLKPENVFWTATGRIVLSDFGIAKAFDGSVRLGGTLQFGATNLYGSPAYMSPEQLAGEPVGPHSDLYALGALLYELASGAAAFDADTVDAILDAVAHNRHILLGERVPEAPAEYATLTEHLLAPDPRRRPESAELVACRLRAMLDSLGVTDPRLVLHEFVADKTPPPPRTARKAPPGSTRSALSRPSSKVWRSIVLRSIGLAIALGGIYVLRERTRVPGARPSAPPAPAATQSQAPATPVSDQDVPVRLRFRGKARVWVDGLEVGSWQDEARLRLSPGKHRLEIRGADETLSLEVMLLAGTEPVFELYGEAAR